MGVLPGIGGLIVAAGGSLIQKGYGYAYGTTAPYDLALGYGTVVSGEPPEPGDLVVWLVTAGNTAINDLTALGWAQQRKNTASWAGVATLAKVLVSGDISSPPEAITDAGRGACGMWVAYSIEGTIEALACAGLTDSYSTGAPSARSVNSSALMDNQVAITMSHAWGDDDNISLAWSGAVPDIQYQAPVSILAASTGGPLVVEVEWGVHLAVGGENITVSQGDDGANGLAAGYVAVTF